MAADEASQDEQAGRITDARGRSVTQLDPVMMHLLHRRGVIPPDVLREIARQVGIGMTRVQRAGFWFSAAGLACVAVAVAISTARVITRDVDFRGFARVYVPFTGMGMGLLGVWLSTRKVRHERIGRVMLQHLRCPHCGYDIRGLPPDPQDGATVCPECGCAWKLSDSPTTGGPGGD